MNATTAVVSILAIATAAAMVVYVTKLQQPTVVQQPVPVASAPQNAITNAIARANNTSTNILNQVSSAVSTGQNLFNQAKSIFDTVKGLF